MIPLKRTTRLLPAGEPIALSDIRDALIIKESELFLMTDIEGNIPPENFAGYGLYKGDTRFLSTYNLSIDGIRPIVLLSTAELGYSSEHYLTNPPLPQPAGTFFPKEKLAIRRQRVISDHFFENNEISNFDINPVEIEISLEFDADFVDIFEVRGQPRKSRGKIDEATIFENGIIFSYTGLDNIRRFTHISFSPAPDRITSSCAVFRIRLEQHHHENIEVKINPDGKDKDVSMASEFTRQHNTHHYWVQKCTQIFTTNDFFDAMIERSLSDIRLLLSSNNHGTYIAAGTPWFNCLFGRDSIIASLQLLPFNSDIARNTLRILARWQGKKIDKWRDEEPGKILHELRTGEMASLDEIPMKPYYGSIDSTPLFILLAHEYLLWTGDITFIKELQPNLVSALDWIEKYGDYDGCGYVEYYKQSSSGLLNQGWKDSHDGIVKRDGTLAQPPIALVEEQGYVYAAFKSAAKIFSLLGNRRLSSELYRKAVDLKKRFNDTYWLDETGYYALALEAGKRPVDSITSNPAHCLWTGIVDKFRAPRLVEQLFTNEMFSGWGIRTLSSDTLRYNPLGYHLGTIWPHDNSIIGMGLKRYGFDHELNELTTAIYDSCRTFDYFRLPELFCGIPRTSHTVPVRYAVACRPQAWAAGTIPFLLQAILGLVPDAPRNRLYIVRPHLPYWLDEVLVRGLRVGGHSIDISYRIIKGETRVSVLAAPNVLVSRVNRWPD